MANATYRGRMIVNDTDYTGSFVDPNPSGVATEDLNTVGIDGKIFNVVGSGGSSVIPNPSGTATENLYTVDIDGTIYDIKSGNGNFKTKVLLNQAATSGTYSLADDYTNYDLLAFWTTGQGYESSEAAFYVMTVDDIKKAQSENRVLCMTGINRWFNFHITTSQFIVDSCSGMTVVKIVGYKIYADCYNPIIYSTEEREVGVWTDGKPLYQKTFDCGALLNAQTKEVSFTEDMETATIIDAFAMSTSEGYVISLPDVVPNYVAGSVRIYVSKTAKKIYIDSQADMRTYDKSYVTIQYTKTTDVAGSGSYNTLGVPNVHYSTNEQVIGTWIDGTSVYKKVVVLASPTNISYNNWQDMGVSITGGDKVLSCFGVATDSTSSPLHAYFEMGGVVTCQTPRNNNESYNVEYLIIEYTKTTD